jgi:hypothetical protein
MSVVNLRSLKYAATGVHRGTSDADPHSFQEELVKPSSLTARIADPLIPEHPTGAFYAKLYEVVDGKAGPRYFGVAFRYGITDISTVNVFLHPVPQRAGMVDGEYIGLRGNWSNLYRYVQYFGVQLGAGKSNMVLVMPMLSNATYTSLGIMNEKWKDILNGILVEVQKVAWPDKAGETMDRNQTALTQVILSPFSRGRSILSRARSLPGMGDYLKEIWDFDGNYQGGPPPPGPVEGGQTLLYDQLWSGAGRNAFHVPLSRWIRFSFFTKDSRDSEGIHGEIPQRLFYHATTVSAYGH